MYAPSEVCIRNFAPSSVWIQWLYSHIPGANTSDISGELISVQIHAAHVFARGRLQENIAGGLFMHWFRARAYSAAGAGLGESSYLTVAA